MENTLEETTLSEQESFDQINAYPDNRSFNNSSLVPAEQILKPRESFNDRVSPYLNELVNICNDIEGRISRIRNSDLQQVTQNEIDTKASTDNLFGKMVVNVNTTMQSLSDTMVEKENFNDGAYRHRFFDGTVYEGQWHNGAIDGFGKVKWSDGNTYRGNWQNNLLHGLGDYTYTNGQKYIGEFRHDKKNGRGRYIWPDGKEYDGFWKEGVQHGYGWFTNSKGIKK